MQVQYDAGGLLGLLGVNMDADARAQRDDVGIDHPRVGELVEERFAVDERNGEDVVDAELALQPGARLGEAGRVFT